MTEEEKQLLLHDLIGRLPYNVNFEFLGNTYTLSGVRSFITEQGIWDYGVISKEICGPIEIEDIKPYLRPMSSMSLAERQELAKIMDADIWDNDGEGFETYVFHEFDNIILQFRHMKNIQDFFNRQYLDYMGLIGKNLALEAPEGMYN